MPTKSPRLSRTAIGLAIFFVFVCANLSFAQRGSFNYINKYSKKNYYFGIALGTNFSRYRVEKSTDLIQNDSIKTVNATYGPGFHIGFIANFGLNKYFDFRLLAPTVSFADKTLSYQMVYDGTVDKKVESVFLEFPIYFRYKSEPYNDVRLFVIAGIKYSMDLSSNSNTRQANEMVQLDAHDLAVELGLGFQIFFPYFILSPEVKFSYGLRNLHDQNQQLVFSSVIDKLFSRGFSISLHFEG
ncbi:type IX secretion/gliding motility protein PorT/SprT [Aureispira anguillae]|uniref:PorT family protein n=1 Tax=Aureispira anguillae TaxID=2864201 RepID=A0A916DRN5_9BACT|nr:PorT family protein [Aureispira anguillae]BDS11964.1 PorT family protein [Aureispira anguillae]